MRAHRIAGSLENIARAIGGLLTGARTRIKGEIVATVLTSTTKAQVSGHKFLTRRVEHGLVLGDVRMISDPLGARRRASLFGLIGTAIICVGSGALAIFAPAIDPGQAEIVQVESGALLVRLPEGGGTALHPVANEASARLVVGKPEAPAKASAKVLDGERRGTPIGIPGAPAFFAGPQPAREWAAVHSDGKVTVVAGKAPAPLADDHGFLARHAGRTWVVTSAGRAELPPADSPLGRSIRRRLGMTVDTPVWDAPPGMLSAITELPPYRAVRGTVIKTGDEYWLQQENGLVPLSHTQYVIARDLGLEERTSLPRELSGVADAPRAVAELPFAPVTWQAPDKVWVRGDGKPSLGEPAPVGIAVAGKATAGIYAGPSEGAFGVDIGHGIVVVTDYGVVHRVASMDDAAALGISDAQPAPWSILALLPEGPELSKAAALSPIA